MKFHTLDVFTNRRFGGNPLAVFPDARGLTDELMQAIARELSLSETVFVLPPQDQRALRRLRIFTPGRELPFAGHPTIGAGFLLAVLGIAPLTGETTCLLLEEGVGLVPVTIKALDSQPQFVQLTVAKLPEFGPPPPARIDLAAALSIQAEDILEGADRPQAVSCGLPFLFVPVRDRQVLARLRVDGERWQRVLKNYWTHELFVFCRDPELPGSSIRARMFAPEFGIHEDPATGSAVAALGGYLGSRDATAEGCLRWTVEQGFEMGRPSLLDLEVDKQNGRITAVRVGGQAVLISSGSLHPT